MINLKLWWESSDPEVFFQRKRALLEVNANSKSFPEDIFVVSKKVYIKVTSSLVLLSQVCFKKMKVNQENTLPMPKGFHKENYHQSSLMKTFTGNAFHVDVVFFLMKKWFFVVSFETHLFCVTQRHGFCNRVDSEFFAIFVARFLQKVDCFLCHQEKPNVTCFITYYIDTCPVCLEILHRVADHFGLSNQKKHWNPR